MKLLVTGASGFLGRAVASLLLSEGHEVRTLQRRGSGVAGVRDFAGSVTDVDAVRAGVGSGQEAVDAVVHLAAKVSLVGGAAEFHAVNVEGTRLLLDESERAGVSRFVHISSPSVAHLGASLVGASATPASPTHARGEYARTKAEAELLALDRDSESMRVIAIRPHAVWGPGDAQLTERIIDRARRSRLPLLGGGRALVDSTYVENAATAISAALARVDAVHGRALVVTNGEPRPVADLIAGMTRAAGVTPPRFSVPAGLGRAAGSVVERVWALWPGRDEPPMTRFLAEQLSTAHWFDQRETRELLQWRPSVTLDEGFARLAAHYAGEP